MTLSNEILHCLARNLANIAKMGELRVNIFHFHRDRRMDNM